MKAIFYSFSMLLRHIARDGMMLFVCFAPFVVWGLLGFLFPLVIVPQLTIDLVRFYPLIDLWIATITPYLLCFASSLAILEELDDHITPYLLVTPVGKTGYLFSRLIMPSLFSMVITWLFLFIGSLTAMSILMMLAISFSASMLAVVASMVIVSFAKNKVEGMAISKISGLLMLGLCIPFFITTDVQYLFSFMPSFWMAKLIMTQDYFFFIPTLLTSVTLFKLLETKYLNRF